ncbi:hypothetical protein HK405_013744 [Cladochytrium tenue]|nr:hypothetical protein HK405_013744 [Cladochytrium tenue]
MAGLVTNAATHNATASWSFGGDGVGSRDAALPALLVRASSGSGSRAGNAASAVSASAAAPTLASASAADLNAALAAAGPTNRRPATAVAAARSNATALAPSATPVTAADGVVSVRTTSTLSSIATSHFDVTLPVAQALESGFRVLDSFAAPWIPTSLFPPKVDAGRLRRPGSSPREEMDLIRLFFRLFDFPLGFIHPWTCFTETKRIHPLLRLSMCAAGAKWCMKDPEIIDWYYEAARNICSEVIERPSLEAAQGVLLLALVSCRHNRRSDAWLRLGMACSLALVLQLDAVPETLSWEMDLAQSWLPRETRRRVWWVCLMADRVFSVVLDRPLFLNYERYKVHKIGKEEVWRSLNDPSSPEHAVLMAHGAGSDLANFGTVLAEIFGQLLMVSAPSIEMLDERSTKYDVQETMVEAALDDWFRRLPTRYITLIVDTANPCLPPVSDVMWPWEMSLFFGYHGCICLLQRRRSFLHVLDIAARRAGAGAYELFTSAGGLSHERARRAAQERRLHNEQAFNKALASAQAMAEMLSHMRIAGLQTRRLPHVVVFFALQGALILLLAEVLSRSTAPPVNSRGVAAACEPPTYVFQGVLLPSIAEPPARSPIAVWLAELVTVFDDMGSADRVADTLRRAADVVLHAARADLPPSNLHSAPAAAAATAPAPPPSQPANGSLLRSPTQTGSSPASSDTVPVQEKEVEEDGGASDVSAGDCSSAETAGGSRAELPPVTGAQRLLQGFQRLADVLGRCLFDGGANLAAAGDGGSDIDFADDLLQEIINAHHWGTGGSGSGGGDRRGNLGDAFFADVQEKGRDNRRSCPKGGRERPVPHRSKAHLSLSEEGILRDWLFTFKPPF